MTIDEVIGASEGAVERMPPEAAEVAGAENVAFSARGNHTAGDIRFQALFAFSSQGLQAVFVTAVEGEDCRRLSQLLHTRYGDDPVSSPIVGGTSYRWASASVRGAVMFEHRSTLTSPQCSIGYFAEALARRVDGADQDGEVAREQERRAADHAAARGL